MKLAGYGISIDLPSGWEGRIFRDPPTAREPTLPVMHVADFPLPVDRNTFGTSVLLSMPPIGTFLALVEYDPEVSGEGLFSHKGLPPRLRQADLDPTAVQIGRTDLAGAQRFFSLTGRAFCMYSVLGREGSQGDRLRALNGVVGTLSVRPRHGAWEAESGVPAASTRERP